MAKKTKKEGKMDLKQICWQHFYETGEIGAYMLYKKVCEENNGKSSDQGNCDKSA